MARKLGRLDFNDEAPENGKRHRAEKTGWNKQRIFAIKLCFKANWISQWWRAWWDAIETVSTIGSSSSEMVGWKPI